MKLWSVQTEKDGFTQPIDKIVIVVSGDAVNLRVVGKCAFENPYRGKPSKVSCTAESRTGTFVAAFASDGSKPVVSGE